MSALTDDQKTHAAALALSLAGADPTLPRSPTSTVAPSATRERGRRALEALRALSDPGALIDEGVLGQGGMGVVTLARQVALDRQVAVKRLKPGVSGDDASGALLAEARLTGALEHPGILPVYAVTREADGRPALVMKRIEGSTWSRLLEDDEALSAVAPGRGRLEAHVAIALQVCNALHFAHSRGVVHRDVKPDNVMVGAFGEVYLMDWGIAAEAGLRGQLAGTPAYMAPEMLGGDGVISPRTDVYLLGSVLHQVLSGRPPHAGADLRGVMESVLASTPRLPPDAPAELVELVTRCMSADPARRPESALSVRLSLEGFLQHQGSRELAAQAAARLDELVVLLSTAAPDVVRVAALFGECRFGFQQALRTWPGNASARAGLEAALTAMARHELARGSWRAAEALMAELPKPPPALAAALDEARERERARALEVKRLEALARAHDPRAGERLRLVTVLALGACWIASPLAAHLLLPRYGHLEGLAPLPVAVLSTLVVLVATRRAVAEARTVLNRQLARLLLLAMPFQALVHGALHALGLSLGVLQVPLLLGYWGFMCTLAALLIEPRAGPAAVGYWLSMLGAFAWPSSRYVFGVVGNLGLFCNVAVLLSRQRKAAARVA